MIGGIKTIQVKAGKEQEFEQLFNSLKREVRANEPGNLYYDLYKLSNSPGNYIVMERYQDSAALKAHETSEHGAAYFPKIRILLDILKVEYYESID